jgi:DNA-binding protein HU-beta
VRHGLFDDDSRPARMGRNPATGESIEIAASKKIAFRPAKELKEAV